MTRVVLLTGNALCNNPRAQKEAETLSKAGFEVSVLGAWLSGEIKQRDRELLVTAPYEYEAVIDVTDTSAFGRAAMLIARTMTGAARKLHGYMRSEFRWQLGYTVDRLLRRALRLDAGLYIAHSEAGLHVARELYRRGLRIGVDMEDWYSEDLPLEARRGRPIQLLQALERDVLREAVHRTCTSAAMAKALVERYGCPEPKVIYNAFSWADRKRLDGLSKDRQRGGRPSIHWYSQTIGPGRGLEDLMNALQWITADVEIHLRGQSAPDYREYLLARLAPQRREQLHFHESVPVPELLSRIAEHDIGYSGEIASIPSRNLTVTNKVLHYLLAGIPAIASETEGCREVAAQAPDAVILWSKAKPDELASRINSILLDPRRLTVAKCAALSAAKNVFCWEKQAQSLIASIKAASQIGKD